MNWREAAVREIDDLKPHWIDKHDWRPRRVDGPDAIDFFVHMTSRRLAGREFLLRLRYQSDWLTAGRRETFVDVAPPHQEGTEFWPPKDAVRAILPEYERDGRFIPCICLRGVWGYHSVLHSDQSMEGTTLLTFLVELQRVLDE